MTSLHIQPEIRGIFKNFGQHQRSINRYCPLPGTNFVNRSPTDPHGLGELTLGNFHRLKIFHGNHFTDTYRLSFSNNHFFTSSPVIMVVQMYIIGLTPGTIPTEYQPPLPINSDTAFSF